MSEDITARYHRGNPESTAANTSLSGEEKARLRGIIGRAVRRTGERGATCDEIEVVTGLTHQTASARCTELLRDGVLIDTGQRRRTRSGRTARVMIHYLVGEDAA